MIQSEVVYLNNYPSALDLANKSILIYDKKLLSNKQLRLWIKTFPCSYGVLAGERLKQLDQFQKHIAHILKLSEKLKTKDVTFISLGGGSVGDFVGFLASVFKRGVPLIHIPSTWLAAIDSSHGGKTALNAGGYKNQIGTFYSAKKIILCRDLLFTQPQERTLDVMGEVIKTVLLQGGALWHEIINEPQMNHQVLWSYLPALVAYKYKIIKKDPFEKKGLRLFLNFGHTMGHVFEAINKTTHGHAVNLGLRFAIEFSVYKKILKETEYQKICSSTLMKKYFSTYEQTFQALQIKQKINSYLSQDKKISQNGCVKFIFLKKIGQPLVKEISLREILLFCNRW